MSELFVVTERKTARSEEKPQSPRAFGVHFCGVFYNPLEILYDAKFEGRSAFLARIAATNRKREARDLDSPLPPVRLKQFK